MRHVTVAVLLAAAAAHAQLASRVWVSGVGDDVNSCGRTDPCLTLSGALAQVADAGEVNALDPHGSSATFDNVGADGGYPVPADTTEVRITTAVTIDLRGTLGALSEGGVVPQGIVIEAGPDDVVVLRNLQVRAHASGTVGIDFRSGKALHLENVTVAGFSGHGVRFRPSADALLVVGRGVYRDNQQAGIDVTPGPGAAARVVITGAAFVRNADGVSLSPRSRGVIVDGTFQDNQGAGVAYAGFGAGPIDVSLERVTVTGSAVGVCETNGGADVTSRMARVVLQDNLNRTLLTGGSRIESYGTNTLQAATCARGFEATSFSLTAGQAMAPATLQLYGGVGAIHVVGLDAGLPPGLRADAGVVFGAPLRRGTFAFPNLLQDDTGCAAPASTWTFTVGCPPQALAPASLPVALAGTSFGVEVALVGAVGDAGVALSGALPPGLAFDGGAIVGVPAELGAFPVQVVAQDSAGCGLMQTLALIVDAGPGFTPTQLVLSGGPSVEFGASYDVVARVVVDGGAPAGTVTFTEDGGALAVVPVSAATARLALVATALGGRTFTAVYSGGGVFGASRAAPLSVQVTPASTRTQITGPATAQVGASLTFTARVSSDAGVPTGSVSFVVDSVAGAPQALDGGAASSSLAFATAGAHLVSARFSAGGVWAGSESTVVAVQVSAPDDAGAGDAGVDGGRVDDAGVGGDAGGGVDAGAGEDAGAMMAADAGAGPGGQGGGCGCNGGPLSVLGLALVALRRSTTRRTSAKARGR